MTAPIETINDHAVGATAMTVTILLPPMGPMPKEEALRLAAWIVAVADPLGDRFQEILEAVLST